MNLYDTTWEHDRKLELRADAEEAMDEDDDGSCCSGILEEE